MYDLIFINIGECEDSKGAFLVKTKNAFIPAKRAHSVSTNWKISTVPRGSERVPEGAPEHSKRSECSVADRSEQT